MMILGGLRIERRHLVYLGILLVVAFLYVAVLRNLNQGTDYWLTVGMIMGPSLVAIGWVVTNEVNILNSRKQHTINLITQYFTNSQRISDKEELNKGLSADETIDSQKVDFNDTASAFLGAALRELNYFDFIGSAVLRSDIDEGLVRRVFGTIVHRYYRQYRPFIEHWQKREPEYWSDFVALFHRWYPGGVQDRLALRPSEK